MSSFADAFSSIMAARVAASSPEGKATADYMGTFVKEARLDVADRKDATIIRISASLEKEQNRDKPNLTVIEAYERILADVSKL